jgi:hypothetical protein
MNQHTQSTGREAIIWDGVCCAGTSNRGVAYLRATNTWLALPGAPLARRRNAAGAWTGTEMIVCGGYIPGETKQTVFNDGAAYTPAS